MRGIDYQLSRFPEDLYLPASTNASDYNQRVLYGFDRMSRSSVSIGFLARNVEPIVKATCARVLMLGSLFRESSIFCYENDSSDNTVAIINQYPSINLYSECLNMGHINNDKSLARRDRMAVIRNTLRSMMLTAKSDYYIVYDGDILGGFSYEGIANSFSYVWDVCASNSLIYRTVDEQKQRLYYDSWAWRDHGKENESDDEKINLQIFQRGEQPIKVFSAFGGLAIYNKIYECDISYTNEDCDHPTLHKQMRNSYNANIVMNPSQIVLYTGTRYLT